ncbi:MAG: transposase [Methylocella sp.]
MLHDQGNSRAQRLYLHRIPEPSCRRRQADDLADRGPAHRATKTRAFVASLGNALRLFYLPPNSPDRNPDELVWKHCKADTVGRSAIQSFADFKAKVKLGSRRMTGSSGLDGWRFSLLARVRHAGSNIHHALPGLQGCALQLAGVIFSRAMRESLRRP